MEKYNPKQAPDPGAWNAMDESERISLVKQFHKRKRVKLPNATMHALVHVIVENQIALGDEMNVSTTLDRLLAEGLNRHDAIHAIGTVAASHIHSMMSGQGSEFNQDAYASDLDALTAEKWRKMG